MHRGKSELCNVDRTRATSYNPNIAEAQSGLLHMYTRNPKEQRKVTLADLYKTYLQVCSSLSEKIRMDDNFSTENYRPAAMYSSIKP